MQSPRAAGQQTPSPIAPSRAHPCLRLPSLKPRLLSQVHRWRRRRGRLEAAGFGHPDRSFRYHILRRSDYMNKNIKYSQNFLTSEKVLNQIIKQLNLKETDTVYEIGTGKGHLTTKLAKISKQVTSIELDSHLFNLSSEKLKLNTRVTLIHQDILQFQFPNKQRYKIVGSIPYHLSTQIIKKVVFESHASDIYLIVEEGFYKRTLDIHRTLGLLLHTQVSIQQLLKLPAECFHPKPKVNSVLIKLTRHTTDVPDKYWKLYTYFVSKWVNREYRQLFTKNQFHQAMKHAKVNNLSTVTYEQVLSIFNSYLLFNGRK
ncbi:23S rRNA (adenine(2058)-N(6))-methyltransferase Erm(B) [Collinsella sp. BG-O-102]|nr:23S rRNA (adenine(2058)-N(6))-methyltransferase Erm(B) [Collinsella sp. BG-O-102]UYI98621.1 MAG: 23S rRNA (adenine(2058)-N(6))-methyltransferase Erm(B) [Coriobacteriaceae bacterium]